MESLVGMCGTRNKHIVPDARLSQSLLGLRYMNHSRYPLGGEALVDIWRVIPLLMQREWRRRQLSCARQID